MKIDWKRLDGITDSIEENVHPYQDYHEGRLEQLQSSVDHLRSNVKTLAAILIIARILTLEELKEIL